MTQLHKYLHYATLLMFPTNNIYSVCPNTLLQRHYLFEIVMMLYDSSYNSHNYLYMSFGNNAVRVHLANVQQPTYIYYPLLETTQHINIYQLAVMWSDEKDHDTTHIFATAIFKLKQTHTMVDGIDIEKCAFMQSFSEQQTHVTILYTTFSFDIQ